MRYVEWSLGQILPNQVRCRWIEPNHNYLSLGTKARRGG